MNLFAKKKMTHAEIVAPLKDMAMALVNYVKEQADTIEALNVEKQKIDSQISFSQEEILKSNNSVEQIEKMTDLPKIQTKTGETDLDE